MARKFNNLMKVIKLDFQVRLVINAMLRSLMGTLIRYLLPDPADQFLTCKLAKVNKIIKTSL